MIEDLATLLMNKTCMERLNKAEVESVLNFLMAGGYLVDPNAPEVVTVPREELEDVSLRKELRGINPADEGILDWTND